jgi:hypothetical protein
MTKLTLPLIAVAVCFAATGCDFKLKRNGSITLASGASIPLNDANGSRAELVAGPAEIQVKSGDHHTIAVRVRQPGRAEINFSAPVNGDLSSGNFTLRGSEIGQSVDIVSARSYVITGPTQWEHYPEDMGNQRCTVDVSWDPCDENWTVAFKSGAGAELGSFASRSFERCNEYRSAPHSCWNTNPFPGPGYPRDPRFPHGGRGYYNDGGFYHGALNLGPEHINFDGR